ncbi:MAG: acetyltransferase [Bryobacteraceae bacterium]
MGQPAEIHVRTLSTTSEFEQAVALQRQIWGFDEIELLPVRFFVVASSVGGQTLGAFDGDRMIGFLLAIPGLKPGGKLYLHSHMTGVLEEYRNRGVARMLKLRQREDALARGFDLVEWTFDPLELKNAYFNLQRLGAVVRRYVLNQYGMTSSRLHGGLPTDRCVAEWWIRSPRVAAIVEGRSWQRPPVEATIEVPAEIARIKHEDPRQARRIQKKVSERFLELLGAGLTVMGFERTPAAGVYLLGRLDPERAA